MFRALTNARPSHLLDPNLFDFANLSLDPIQYDENSDEIPKLR